MLIFYQLLSHFRRRRLVVIVVVGVLSSLLESRLWRLVVGVVVVGVSSLALFFRCRQQCNFLCLRPSASAPCHRRSLVVVIKGGVTPIETNIYFCS